MNLSSTMSVPQSALLVPGNCVFNPQDRTVAYAAAGGGAVLLHTVSGNAQPLMEVTAEPPVGNPPSVHSLEFCAVPGGWLLVLAGGAGVQFWSVRELNSRFVYAHPLGGREGHGAVGHFARGIASGRSGAVYVGTSSGRLLVFDADSDTVRGPTEVKEHSFSVSAVAADGNVMASADDRGDIVVFTTEQSATGPTRSGGFTGKGYPCNAMAMRGAALISAFADGSIRMHDVFALELKVNVAAHSRAINALHLHATEAMVCSVGEDSMLNVWTFSVDQAVPSVSMLFSQPVKDCLLTGCAFVDQGPHARIALTSYDTDSVQMWCT